MFFLQVVRGIEVERRRCRVEVAQPAAVAERLDVCVCADLSLAGINWQLQPVEQVRAAITGKAVVTVVHCTFVSVHVRTSSTTLCAACHPM